MKLERRMWPFSLTADAESLPRRRDDRLQRFVAWSEKHLRALAFPLHRGLSVQVQLPRQLVLRRVEHDRHGLLAARCEETGLRHDLPARVAHHEVARGPGSVAP